MNVAVPVGSNVDRATTKLARLVTPFWQSGSVETRSQAFAQAAILLLAPCALTPAEARTFSRLSFKTTSDLPASRLERTGCAAIRRDVVPAGVAGGVASVGGAGMGAVIPRWGLI